MGQIICFTPIESEQKASWGQRKMETIVSMQMVPEPGTGQGSACEMTLPKTELRMRLGEHQSGKDKKRERGE